MGQSTTVFERMRTEQLAKDESPHAPFRDEDEWGLVQWLMKETTQGGADRFAKLPIVSPMFSYYTEEDKPHMC